MTRTIAATVLLFVTALGVAHAVPARPLYEPPEQPKMPKVVAIDLRGTTWRGTDLIANRIMIFMPDGTLHYGVGAKTTFNKATWKLEGDNLYFEMNNQYREFKGKVIGDTIVGDSWNKVNKRWDTKLQRDPASK